MTAARISVSNALAIFCGQDARKYQMIGSAFDKLSCSAQGRYDFPLSSEQVALIKEFADFLVGEADLQSIGIVPDLGSADAVYREPSCERSELTGEVV